VLIISPNLNSHFPRFVRETRIEEKVRFFESHFFIFLFFGTVKIIHRFQKSSSFSKELSAAKIISFVF